MSLAIFKRLVIVLSVVLVFLAGACSSGPTRLTVTRESVATPKASSTTVPAITGKTTAEVQYFTPQACIDALDVVDRFGQEMSKRVPVYGGMSSQEVNELAAFSIAAWKKYEPLAKECKAGK